MRSRSVIACPHLDVALHDDVEHALVFVAELVLVQLAQAQAGLQHDLADALLELAAQDFHERGLAAAVGADQAIAVAVGELDGDLFEERLGTKLNRDVGSREHFCPISEERAPGWAPPSGRACVAAT